MKKSFSKALALAMALCLVLSLLPMAVCADGSQPEFVNGDFEVAADGDVVPGWSMTASGDEYSVEEHADDSGNHYLSFTGTAGDRGVKSSPIAVEAGEKYVLFFRFTSDVGTGLRIINADTDQNLMSELWPGSSVGVWTPYTKEFTVPDDCTAIYVRFRVNKPGMFGCDDFKLIKVEEGKILAPLSRWDVVVGTSTGRTAVDGGIKDNGYAVYKKLITSFDSFYHIPYDSTEANPFVSRGGITDKMFENGTLKFTNETSEPKTITIAQPYSANILKHYPVALAVDFKVDNLEDDVTFTVGMKDPTGINDDGLDSGGYAVATFNAKDANQKAYWRKAMTYDVTSGAASKYGLGGGVLYLTLTLSGKGTVYVDDFYFMSAPNVILLNPGFEYLQGDETPAVWPEIRSTMAYKLIETEADNYIKVEAGGSVPISSATAPATNPFLHVSNYTTGITQTGWLPGQFKVSVDEKLVEGTGTGVAFKNTNGLKVGLSPVYTQAAATEWTTKSLNVLLAKTSISTNELSIQCSDAAYYLDDIKVERIENGCKVYKDGAEVTGSTLPAGKLTIEYTKPLTEGKAANAIYPFTATDGTNIVRFNASSTYPVVQRSWDNGGNWREITADTVSIFDGATADGAAASVVTAVYKIVDGVRVLDQIKTTVAAGAKYVLADEAGKTGYTNVGILPTMASHEITLAPETYYEVQTMVWDGITTMQPINMYSFKTAAE